MLVLLQMTTCGAVPGFGRRCGDRQSPGLSPGLPAEGVRRWHPGQDLCPVRDHLGAGVAVQQNLPGFCNRGLVHYLKVEETGLVTGTYTLEIHGKDSFDSLLYKRRMTPASFEDWLPFWVQDYDGSGELHLKIRNNDLDQPGLTG